ncbi:MAG: FAD-binding protein [Acidobacteriota bacterium]
MSPVFDPMKLATELWKLGVERGFRVIRWTKDGNVDYQWAREIANSRFDLNPFAVALPRTAEDVAECVKLCRRHRAPFRVRSGGHQHEGMSSIEDGVVLRLSELSSIAYRGENRAWIGVGKPLKEIYDELELRGKTIPGGGCWSVNVGGLALGGGWGTSVRKMGLTCDNFEEVEVVTAEGDVIRARADNEHGDLFWALRGGGGGNFGIVTRFLFRLWDIGPVVSTIRAQWKEPENKTDQEKEEYLTRIVEDYLKMQADFPIGLTTSMGLRVRHRFMAKDKYFPLGLSGKYYGTSKELERALKKFLDKHPPSEPVQLSESRRARSGGTPAKASEPDLGVEVQTSEGNLPLAQLIDDVADFVQSGSASHEVEDEAHPPDGAAYVQKAPPRTTCLAPWPHKVSSGFPKGPGVYSELARNAVRVLRSTNEERPANAARLFMVLHSMPGKKGPEHEGKPRPIHPWESAFYWRERDFLVQFQAWWAEPCLGKGDSAGRKAYQKDVETYLCWIRSSRKALDAELDGAFINFVDRDLPLEAYYGANFARLREIKQRYDRDNVFHFPMGIPPNELPLEQDAIRSLSPSGFRIVTRGHSRYDEARSIANARFDFRPLAIAFPRTAEHVAHCVRYCIEHNLQLRISSGGHQHEGMCSADDVLMVRLSEMDFLDYVDGTDDQAWIGAGARLHDVYAKLQKRHRILPGGGCKHVAVGGLTLGGGWGLSARRYGLACDSVLAVKVVLADGRIVEATRDNKFKELFWALLGGGGGNFGIVTSFLFRLRRIEPNLSKYKLYWRPEGTLRRDVIQAWLRFQREKQTEDTTSYLVLYADREKDIPGKDNDNDDAPLSIYAGGMSYRHLRDLKEEIGHLMSDLPTPKSRSFWELYPHPESDGELPLQATTASVGDFKDYASPPPGLLDLPPTDRWTDANSTQPAHPCQAEVPIDNCVGSFPHKVTSAFPKEVGSAKVEAYESHLAEALAEFLEHNPVSPYVKAYVSLYSLGGAVARVEPNATPFWYRKKSFILQIEAWWSYPHPDPEPCGCRYREDWQRPYIDWVRRFRGTLRDAGLVEGAFINFVDRDLEERNKTPEDRRKLLHHYYGENLDRLMEAKAAWDPSDFFRFGMSIPLPRPKSKP